MDRGKNEMIFFFFTKYHDLVIYVFYGFTKNSKFKFFFEISEWIHEYINQGFI